MSARAKAWALFQGGLIGSVFWLTPFVLHVLGIV